jgi:hypothetical protein
MKSFLSFYSVLFITACQLTTPYQPVKSIKNDVTILAADSLEGREIGTIGEQKAAEYLVARMKDIGLTSAGDDGYRQLFYVQKSTNPHEQAKVTDNPDSAGTTGINVLGMIDNPGDQFIVIGAHYDHLGYGGISSLERGSNEIHNGADDNASGTAGLLHLAQILKERELNHDILFFAISGEEQGLWGSNYWTNHPTIPLDKINCMINMDMIGRLDTTRGLAIYGTGTAPDWDTWIDETNLDSLKIIRKPSGKGPSDHTSFYLKDIPVLHFFTGQHEDYHRPGDDADKINVEGIISVTSLIERIIPKVDKADKLAFQETKDESTNTPRFKVTLGVMPDYLFDGKGMKIADVSEDKPAALAGIIANDIVLQMGDSLISDMMSYMKALSAFEKGQKTNVKVKRGEEEITVEVTF